MALSRKDKIRNAKRCICDVIGPVGIWAANLSQLRSEAHYVLGIYRHRLAKDEIAVLEEFAKEHEERLGKG